MNELQLAGLAVGGLVTGMGALAFSIRAISSRKNGTGHSPPCSRLEKVEGIQGSQATAIAVIQANQKNDRESLARIERNVGALVDGPLHKTDPGIERRTENK